MSKEPLSVAFVWHMHQPFYKDMVTGEYVLPWVRLHAIKDYYDMAAILDGFPAIKQTFNVVPSLLEQMEQYVRGAAVDKHLALTIKTPGDLTHDERTFILQNFFMANWETMVNPYKRYHELLLKRGRFVTAGEIRAVAGRFTDQEMLDLQVWFNLSWFGHIYRTTDPIIRGLMEKGRNFTPEDKSALISKQKELMSRVIPKYRELEEKGQIEVSVTPYYHPILPLLVDTNIAKEAVPNISLPEQRFRHPEDARRQIDEAVEYYRGLFGKAPSGMWPSEGSVSEDVIPLVADAGIKWIATDEEILARSLGRGVGRGRELTSQELFRPYALERNGRTVNIIFRDHNLSDLIGFTYSKWPAEDAARDFVTHLRDIRGSLPDDGRKYLVSVILDGENAWEYYRDNGWDFLGRLYEKLSNEDGIRTVRVCDFLAENPPREKLRHLFAGSWINHNFRVWIGHAEDNRAWDHLSAVRFALESSRAKNADAWKELYIAEGSDWCWWYGDDHSSDNDEVFDQLFRKHLKNIYHLIGKQYPHCLDLPIKQVKEVKPTREPAYLVSPVIDGEVTNFYEWLSAGFYDIGRLKGTMHQAETVVKAVYYGFDTASFHIRVDTGIDLKNSEAKELSFVLNVNGPGHYKIRSFFDREKNRFILNVYDSSKDDLRLVKTLGSVAIADIVEMSVPFADIGAGTGDEVQLILSVEKGPQELERWPRGGVIDFKVPGADYIEKQWSV